MREEIFEKIKNAKNFNEYISSLDGKKLKELLIFLNSEARGITNEEGGFFQIEGKYFEDGTYKEPYMIVGQLKAPKKEIQNKAIEKMAKMLKQVKNVNYKAVIMYNLLNYLHLFEDGNGRTSRLVYDLILNGEINKNDIKKYYSHETGEIVGKRNSWDKTRNVQDPTTITTVASQFLMKYLLNEGLIYSPNEDLSKHLCIKTISGGESSALYMSKNNKSQLSRKTLDYVNRALTDNNESISSSALSLLIMLTQKEDLQFLKNYYSNKEFKIEGGFIRNVICIGNSRDEEDYDVLGAYPEEISKRVFRNWLPEDYLKVIDITDKLKECIIDLLIDFAERPDSFKYGQEGVNVIEALIQGKIKDDGNFRIEKEIFCAPFEIDTETRTYRNMQEIREILHKPRNFDEEKFLIDTYEKFGIKNSDLSQTHKMIKNTLEKTKMNKIDTEKNGEDIEDWN